MSAAELNTEGSHAHAGAGSRASEVRPELITNEHALLALRSQWAALWQRCPWSTPFQSPEWQLAWWRHLGGGALRVIAIRHGERLVGLAPLFLYGTADAPRRLALMGSGISDYDDVLLDPEYAVSGMDVILGEIAAWRTEWSAGSFPELRADSPLLHARIPATLRVHVAPSSTCPVLPMAASFDALEREMGHTHRIKLRQCHKRLERAGGATVEVASDHNVHALLDALALLHERRWRERTEHGVLGDARVRALHHDVAPELLARGCLRLFALRLGGSIIAVLYAFAWRDRLYCYLSGLDPGARYYSPGVAIVRAVIEHAIAEGIREVDFLRGAERYKYLWGAVDHLNHELHLHPCAPGIAP